MEIIVLVSCAIITRQLMIEGSQVGGFRKGIVLIIRRTIER